MAANLHEIATFSLVILGLDLLTTDDELRAFQASVEADLRPGPGISFNPATGQSQQTRVFHLDRDRVVLNLSPLRSSFTREFPYVENLESETTRFAQIVDHALMSRQDTENTPHDFGFNTEMVFDQDQCPTAFEFLGQRLIRSENATAPDRLFIGGTCRFIIRDELGQWTYNLEPRHNDPETSRIFVNVNLHHEQRPLPAQGEITTAISQMVANTQDLIDRIAG